MKKKVIFVFLALILLVVNVKLGVEIKQESLFLSQLFSVSSAQLEGDGSNYINEYIDEQGLCNYCYHGYWNTCECNNFGIYCYAGGSENCDAGTMINVNESTCIQDGGPC